MALSNAVPKCPTGRTLMEDRRQKKLTAAQQLEAAYALVDIRDQKVCRISGRRLTAGATDPRDRLERHHMKPRSTSPGRRHDPANILTVSAFIHKNFTAHKLHAEGDANLRDENGRFCVQLWTLHDEGWRFSRLV